MPRPKKNVDHHYFFVGEGVAHVSQQVGDESHNHAVDPVTGLADCVDCAPYFGGEVEPTKEEEVVPTEPEVIVEPLPDESEAEPDVAE